MMGAPGMRRASDRYHASRKKDRVLVWAVAVSFVASVGGLVSFAWWLL